MKYGILVPSYLKFFPYNLEIMNPFFIYLSILCTLPFFQQSSDYVTRTFISFISGLNLFFLMLHIYLHIPLNQLPLKPSHIYLFTHPTPSFFNPTKSLFSLRTLLLAPSSSLPFFSRSKLQ